LLIELLIGEVLAVCDKTLLIIDDNSAMLSATESALQGIYNVATANTGRKGLEAFKTC
jgi:CheY-like chemotaxis protein